MQDQVIRYDPHTRALNGTCVNQRVRFNVRSLIRAPPATSAPTEVPKDVINALPPDPDIVKLERRRTDLYRFIESEYRFINRAPESDIVKEYKQLGTQITTTETAL